MRQSVTQALPHERNRWKYDEKSAKIMLNIVPAEFFRRGEMEKLAVHP